MLGKGSFGEVYKGVLINRNTNTYVAVKKFLLDPKKRDTIEKEVMAMKEIRHPNIVSFIDCIRK